MQTLYVLATGTSATEAIMLRAESFGAAVIVGDPTGQVTTFPSVVVVSPAASPQVFADNTGQAATSAVQSAQSSATTAETTDSNNYSTLLTEAATALTNNATFLAISSPTNAQALAQIQALTRQVDALIHVVAQIFSNTTGT